MHPAHPAFFSAFSALSAGGSTTPHYHPGTEEIYYILEGTGRM